MNNKLLTEHHLEFLSLKGGCTGSSESTLIKITHCWKNSAEFILSGSALILINRTELARNYMKINFTVNMQAYLTATHMNRECDIIFFAPPPAALGRGQKVKY